MCLFVGSGGQQVPKGLEGDGTEETEENAIFEKRRTKLAKKGKDGKRKNLKDRDWIIKKKEVCRFRL